MSKPGDTAKCGSLGWEVGSAKTTAKRINVDFSKRPSRSHETPDGLLDMEGPVGRMLGSTFTPQARRVPLFREGVGFEIKSVKRFAILASWAHSTENAFMNIIQQLEGNYEAAEKLWDSYKSRLDQFRSAIKNDVTSLEASSRKATEATHKMKVAYGQVIDLLNSDDMAHAVENAERLAAAMTALAKLQSHKLVFAVTDQSATATE